MLQEPTDLWQTGQPQEAQLGPCSLVLGHRPPLLNQECPAIPGSLPPRLSPHPASPWLFPTARWVTGGQSLILPCATLDAWIFPLNSLKATFPSLQGSPFHSPWDRSRGCLNSEGKHDIYLKRKKMNKQTNCTARELLTKSYVKIELFYFIRLLCNSFSSRFLDKGTINSKLSKNNRKINMGNEH